MSDGHHTTPTPAGFVPHVIAHHFRSAEEEFQAGKLGFWLFLATEILLFGGLFAAYFYYHGAYPETFQIGGKTLSWKLGALNTSLLLFSSFTMAMAVRSTQLAERAKAMGFMAITFLCGVGFMVVKAFEYTGKYEHGLLPNRWYNMGGRAEEAMAHDPSHYGVLAGLGDGDPIGMYYSLYFTMTAIHGLHVLIGMCAIGWAFWGVNKRRFHSGHYLPVDLVGLYWHLVDLIWIFLFPLLYLVP